MKMKISVLTTSYPRFPGDGTAPFIMSICEQLVALGNQVEVVAPYDIEVRDNQHSKIKIHRFRYVWPDNLHIMGHARTLQNDISLHPLAYMVLPFFVIASFLKLLRVTARQKSQIIHAHWILPNGLIAVWVASIRRIPLIISLHGSDIFVATSNPVFKLVARWIFARTTYVTACSPELARKARNLGAKKIRVIPYGADPNIFHPTNDPSIYVKSRHIDKPNVRIIALGRMVYKKGFSLLIEAMPKILRVVPSVHLYLGGGGNLLDELRVQAQELSISEHVSFVGKIPWGDVPKFLANGDIFVLPSIRDQKGNVDGLPTVLLEAMSVGIAVVASDIGGVRLVITNNKNGLIFPPNDVNALAEAVIDLANNERKRKNIAKTARKDIENKFNWRRVAGEFSSIMATAIWQQNCIPRLGTVYRDELLNQLDKNSSHGRVLDVGCHDGFFLSNLDAPIKVGVDLNPIPGAPGVQFVCADATHLPFRDQAFDHVYALDVIEHIDFDEEFVSSLCRVIAPLGTLKLTTPNANIRMFPAFLTGWISRKWGHYNRNGYTTDELFELFEDKLDISIKPLQARAFRSFYLVLKLFSLIFPRVALRFIRLSAGWDVKITEGDHGFHFLTGKPKTAK